jgi:hypothetical protein
MIRNTSTPLSILLFLLLPSLTVSTGAEVQSERRTAQRLIRQAPHRVGHKSPKFKF